MKRAFLAMALTAGSLVSTTLAVSPAEAACAPPANEIIYSIRNATKTYYGTNVVSDWVYPKYGQMGISYSQSKTAELNVSTTATVTAEAGAIFAKASASLGVTVGGSWSRTQTWSYDATIPKDPYNLYRLHLYHYSASFEVMKKTFSFASCNYVNKWSTWHKVNHAPAQGNTNVWRVDKTKA